MWLILFGVVLPWVIVGIGSWLGYKLLAQNGLIMLRIEALDNLVAKLGPPPDVPEGLAPGAVAPQFELPELNGGRVSLGQFHGRRVLLVFFSSNCTYCEQMAPELAALPLDGSDQRPIPLLVTSADREEMLAFVSKYGLKCLVLLQKKGEISTAYKGIFTPSGYLIDEEGIIISELAVGAARLLGLANPLAVEAEEPRGDGVVTGVGETGPDGRSEGMELKHEIRLPIRTIPQGGVGVGDLVKRVTEAVGIKACRGCERRRQALNRWVIKGSGGKVSRESRKDQI